jgi:hypothetical protein
VVQELSNYKDAELLFKCQELSAWSETMGTQRGKKYVAPSAGGRQNVNGRVADSDR